MTIPTELAIENGLTQYAIARTTADTLQRHGVRFGLWSGMHAALIGGHRLSDDVDYWVPDDDMPLVEAIYSHRPVFLGNNDRRIVRLGEHDDVEIMSHMDVATPVGKIALRMTRLAQSRITEQQFGTLKLPCVDPADTILLKGILQRGSEVGKHDLEDIEAIMRSGSIDAEYLRERVKETESIQRVRGVFRELRLLAL